MIGVALSLVLLLAFGYFVLGPTNRGYSAWGWGALRAFSSFGYLLTIIMSLIIGGFIDGRPVAPFTTQLIFIAYAAGAALATGIGAGARSGVDQKNARTKAAAMLARALEDANGD